MSQRLTAELQALDGLELTALRAAWSQRWRSDPPAFRSRDLLRRALAYKLQAEALGDLPAARKRQAAELAKRFAEDRTFTPVPGPVLKVGSSLIREWRRVRHEVAVAKDGFVLGGVTYRSLSEVARVITGTRWNGHVFFGLKARPGARP